MARIARPTYDVGWYTPSEIKAKLEAGGSLEKEVRKEYTRLRDISQKRLKRLAAAGYTNTEVYQRNVNHYPKLKDIKTKSELAQRLSDLSRFVGSSQSTVKGIKSREQKTLETLKESGYTFVNESNLKDFGDFMEQYRDQLLDMDYDSGDAAELYRIVEKHNLDPDKVAEDFEWYLDNLEKAAALRKAKSSTGNTENFKKRLEKKIKKGSRKK
jgi:hypothetical protein